MTTKAERDAAKAAAKAERDAAKAAAASAEPEATAEEAASIARGIIDNAWKSIRGEYVFVADPQTAKAQATGNFLAGQPRVPLTVFPLADNPDEVLYQGGINGFFFSIVLGVPVEVPQGIAEHVTQSRIANNRITKSIKVLNPYTGQPVNVNLDHASPETRARLGLQ